MQVREIGDYVWPTLEPVLRQMADVVRAHFRAIGSSLHRISTPNVILAGCVSFDVPPFTKQYEDIVIAIEAWSSADKVEVRDSSGNVTEILESLCCLPNDAGRILLTSDIAGMSIEAIVDGPRTWIDIERELVLVHRDLDAWIEATQRFLAQNTDMVLRALAAAVAKSASSAASGLATH